MDIRIHVGRRGVLLVVAAVGLLVAGGAAYATIADSGGVLTACRLNSNGSLRLIDPSSSSGPLSHCTANETQVSWNQDGQPGAAGKDGVSPTVAQLAAGDSHCANGGAAITDASGNVAYACNGSTGAPGQPGKDGAPFNGTFTSPNGQFTLTVSDAGVTVVGPDSSISLPAGGGIKIHGGDIQTVADDSTATVAGDETTTVGHDRTDSVGNDATATVGRNRTVSVAGNDSITIAGNRSETVHKNATARVDVDRTEQVGGNDSLTVSSSRTEHVGTGLQVQVGGTASILGSLLSLNGGSACAPAARLGDQVSSGQIVTGSPTVCIGG
jgi:hypothetical protein